MTKLSVASIMLAAALLLPASVATAGPAPALDRPTASLIEKAQFWDVRRCRAWRRECADRWGWRTERFHRCLARHGCERHRYGDRWD
jgi:hypothetical protein